MNRRAFIGRMASAVIGIGMLGSELLARREAMPELLGRPLVEGLEANQAELNRMIHEMFVERVVPHLERRSPTLSLMGGEVDRLVFPVDLRYTEPA